MANRKRIFFETRYFGFVIGCLVFVLFLLLQSFSLFKFLDMVILDANLNLRSAFSSSVLQLGVTEQVRNPNISSDILIVGVDNRSMDRFGKWPWPRYRHADFLNTLGRIKNQNERERAVMLDFFFLDKSSQPEQDALLADSIGENKRLVLETVLDPQSGDASSLAASFDRFQILMSKQKPISHISGASDRMIPYYGISAPIKPITLTGDAYGHPNFNEDADKTFRRQELVVRVSQLIDTINIDNLSPEYKIDLTQKERLAWIDKDGIYHSINYPLTSEGIHKLKQELSLSSPPIMEDTNNDGTPDNSYNIVNRYQDYFIPSITLTLALKYFNKTVDDIDVTIGDHILIKAPESFNMQTGKWEPYKIITKQAEYNARQELISAAETKDVPELRIPIDESGAMLINFMGPPSGDSSSSVQTFPVRSYAGYAARATGPDPESWPSTLSLGNKIIMAGIFSQGAATDEKKTPFGIMYGIEVHANALNTILMDKFIYTPSPLQNALILFVACLVIAFFASRLNPPLALVLTIISIICFYFAASLIFDFKNLFLNFSVPSFAMLGTMISIIVYRVMTEEKEKQRIHAMFGKYVSKTVVDQMVATGNQPELGGVDKELTVLFSDIRGFTTLSEAMTPQELVNHLNMYLTAMTDIIMDSQGTLDKYVGDEIMCFWGAPVSQSDHALRACRCALRQMEKLAELNAGWPTERRIDIGIGINSGIMTVGNMGSIGRMNYTLMGDNVNLGARLEGTNKQYHTHIILSEFTYGLVKDHVVVRELDNIRVKGKNKPVLIYELIDVKE